MSNTTCRCLSSVSTHAVDRRAVLRSTGQRGLAAGLLAAGLGQFPLVGGLAVAAPAGRLQDEPCPDLRVFAKKRLKVEGAVDCGELCACGDSRVYRIVQEQAVALAATDCDETAGPIPDGTMLEVRIDRSVRVPGPAGTWVGSHEGKFVLNAPGGTVEGQLWGVIGIDSCQGNCQNPERDEGMLVGQGTGDFERCVLVANYRSEVRFGDRLDPCSIDWDSWDLDVRGILACPCDGGDGPNGGLTCVGFESLGAGTSYAVGDTFADGGVTVSVKEFEDANGAMVSTGSAMVDAGGEAGGSGQELDVRSVNLMFDFGGPVSSVSLAVADRGGNLNIEINGEFKNFNDFPDIDGASYGGVDVGYISTGGLSGVLKLLGPIQSFFVGGEELDLDDLCFE